jgi:hypothetical protein
MCLKELLALAALDVTKKDRTVTDLDFFRPIKKKLSIVF